MGYTSQTHTLHSVYITHYRNIKAAAFTPLPQLPFDVAKEDNWDRTECRNDRDTKPITAYQNKRSITNINCNWSNTGS